MDFYLVDTTKGTVEYGNGVFARESPNAEIKREAVSDRLKAASRFHGLSFSYLPKANFTSSLLGAFPKAAGLFGCISSLATTEARAGQIRNNAGPMALYSPLDELGPNFNPASLILNPSLVAPFANSLRGDATVFKALTSVFEGASQGLKEGSSDVPCFFGDAKITPFDPDLSFLEANRGQIDNALVYLILTSFQKPIALRAPQDQLPRLIKTLLSLLPAPVAQQISYSTLFLGNDPSAFLVIGLAEDGFPLPKGQEREVFEFEEDEKENDEIPYLNGLKELDNPFRVCDQFNPMGRWDPAALIKISNLLSAKKYDLYLDLFEFEPQGSETISIAIGLARRYLNSLGQSGSKDDPLLANLLSPIIDDPTIALSAENERTLVTIALSFSASPVNRISYMRFLDNLVSILTNSKDPEQATRCFQILRALVPSVDYYDYLSDVIVPEKTSDPVQKARDFTANLTRLEQGKTPENFVERRDLAPFLDLVVDAFAYIEQKKKARKDQIFLETLFTFFAEGISNVLYSGIIARCLQRGSVDDIYFFLNLIIKSSEPLSIDRPEVYWENVVHESTAIVSKETNFPRNVVLVEELAAAKVEPEKFAWLSPYLVREFVSYDALCSFNQDLIARFETGRVDVSFIRQVQMRTISYLFAHQKEITVEHGPELLKFLNFYNSHVTLDQKDDDFTKQNETVFRLVYQAAHYQDDIARSMQCFGTGGQFDTEAVAFIARTNGKHNTAAQLRLIYGRRQDACWVLAILLPLGVPLLLVPFLFVAQPYYIFGLPMILVSLGVSIYVLASFSRFTKGTRIKRLLLANLFVCYLPILIADIVLMILYYI